MYIYLKTHKLTQTQKGRPLISNNYIHFLFFNNGKFIKDR